MRPLLLVPLLSLVACGSGSDISLTNASLQDVAAATQGQHLLNPGKWEVTTRMVSLDLGPNAPAGMAQAMNGLVGQAHTESTCVTAEEAARPPMGNIPNTGNCRFDRFQLGHGRIEATMHCDSPANGGGMQVSQIGTLTDTNYDMTATVRQTNRQNQPAGGMVMQIAGRRSGACDH